MCIFTPWKLQPHMKKNNFLEVNFQNLKDKGFRFIIFDKDNTLADHHDPEIKNEDFYKKLKEIQKIFGADNTAILTNYFGSGAMFKDGEKIEIDFIQTNKKKPFCGKSIKAHFNTKIKNSGDKKNEYFKGDECIFVGDRLATDVLQANVIGGFGIFVEPFDLEGESRIDPGVKYARWFEHLIWKYITGWKISEYKGEVYNEDVKED